MCNSIDSVSGPDNKALNIESNWTIKKNSLFFIYSFFKFTDWFDDISKKKKKRLIRWFKLLWFSFDHAFSYI